MRLFAKALSASGMSLLMSAAAWAEEAAVGEHATGAAKVFPPFDTTQFGPQLFWLVLLFGLLYWLMSRRALPRIADTFAARKAQIDRDLASASQMQKKAEDAEAAYTAAVAKARADATATATSARDAANAEADKRRTAVESDMAARVMASEERINAAKAAAMSNVSSIATDAAAAIVARLTGSAPSAADVKSAIAAALGDRMSGERN